MHQTSIARNYAEALLDLARKAGAMEAWGTLITAVADAVRNDVQLTNFLAAPQVSSADKSAVIGKAFAGTLPRTVVLFLQKLVENRRQTLIPEIAVEYATLVDEAAGRVHAQVTVAREPSAADRERITQRLSERLGKVVVPHLEVNPAILGGAIVRVGDRVMDGSVRKRLSLLRTRLTTGR
jgi:F-type H+-transporting ATPase subunit delta